jgi:anaerobic ribonucleoside-triphosphate reductase activating protein
MINTTLSISQIVPATGAEGPGRRFALWFQGCPLRCPGCCNPQMLPFEGGTSLKLIDLLTQIRMAKEQHAIEGITLLGGEPFAHAEGAAKLAQAVHALDLSVMTFTGYLLEDLRARREPDVDMLLCHTDILVDGPYQRDLPETKRRWIGSGNQRVHFLSARCSADDPRWRLANTLELRLKQGALTINGFPAPQAIGLWKRLR